MRWRSVSACAYLGWQHAGFPRFPCLWRGVTVDNALLRCWLAVLLWADIRASMSSSSSENSCGRQRWGLMKSRMRLGSWPKRVVSEPCTQQLCVGAHGPASGTVIRFVWTDVSNSSSSCFQPLTFTSTWMWHSLPRPSAFLFRLCANRFRAFSFYWYYHVIQQQGSRDGCLPFHWSRGQSGSWGWGHRCCAQNQALTDPSRSDCDLVRTEARVEGMKISALSSWYLFQYLFSNSSAILLLCKPPIFPFIQTVNIGSLSCFCELKVRKSEAKQPGRMRFRHSGINTGSSLAWD